MSDPANPGRKFANQAQNTFEKAASATREASGVAQEAMTAAAQDAAALNLKMIEFSRANANAAFDFATRLMQIKSPSEFMEVSSTHMREQMEALSRQASEIAALTQKATQQAAGPLASVMAKATGKPAWAEPVSAKAANQTVVLFTSGIAKAAKKVV